MRTKFLVVGALVGALAVVPAAIAGNGREKATGGGQILLSSDGKGAGNTIAFTAQEQADGRTTGQVQYIDRSAGKGRDQVKFHGVVDCLDVDGTLARVEGVIRGTGDRFTLLAQDNGEGANAAGADMVFFEDDDNTPACEQDDEDADRLVMLGRGNVQVRDDAMASSSRTSKRFSYKRALKLAGLR